jgi:SAM-dependent methyltransferase
MKKKNKAKLLIDEKYNYYEAAVQSPEGEIEILTDAYIKLRKKMPTILREDFCGTSALSVAWIKANQDNTAYGVDLDMSPLEFAFKKHLKGLSPSDSKKIKLICGNVLTVKTPPSDIVVALNFSYFIFKERMKLKEYFKSAYDHLKKDGVFFIDLFGGYDAQKEIEEKTDRGDFYYYWDCLSFNPINHHVKFAIHFKPKTKKATKIENVFEYDWRWWTMPELKDLLIEVGFKNIHALWEGDDGKGGGNGNFSIATNEENCESWVAYLAACK